MTRIDRYFARRILSTLLKTVLVFAFLYVFIDLITARQRTIEKYEVPWGIVVQYYLTHAPTLLFKFQAMALALLVSTLFVLGKAAQDSEITALLAGGVSLGRIARWPILIALGLAVGVFTFENTAGVRCAEIATQLDREYFERFSPNRDRGPSWTNLGEEGWSCHIRRFNDVALTGKDVLIHAFTDHGMEEIRANRIFWDPDRHQWILEDGRWASFQREPTTRDIEIITQRAAPFDESPEMLFALSSPPETKTVVAQYRDLKRAESMGLPATAGWVAFHTKFSRPILCFVIIWLAIPFAIKLRRGGLFISFGMSIALGLGYVMLYVVSVGLGSIGLLPPFLAAWLPTVVFLGGGLVLFWRMPS